MKLTILSLILASLVWSADAKICIGNAAGLERCRTITADAWKAANDLANASCTTTPGTPEVPATEPVVDLAGNTVTPGKPAIPAVAPVTTCTYANPYDVVFQHVRGYLRDLMVQYPGAALTPLKKAVVDAQKALEVEAAKSALSVAP